MTHPVLELVSVTAGYGDNPIVRDFSARLAAGSITTLIGPNGAGKSTLLRAIYGTNRFFDGQLLGHTLSSSSFFASSNLILIAAAAGVLFGGAASYRNVASLVVVKTSTRALFDAAPGKDWHFGQAAE